MKANLLIFNKHIQLLAIVELLYHSFLTSDVRVGDYLPPISFRPCVF
jgi:hypothetical protein